VHSKTATEVTKVWCTC